MKPPKAREGDEWVIAEYRFRRPAVGPFLSEDDARLYLTENMPDSRGWHLVRVREPVPSDGRRRPAVVTRA